MSPSTSEYVRTSGPPIWTSPAGTSAPLGGLDQVLEHVVDRDRLGPVSKPGGRDHRRQSLHQVAHRAVRLAAGPDHHGGAEVHERWALLRERGRRGGAAAQVLGALVAEPAQVDDALDTVLPGHPREIRRGAALPLGEALAVGASPHGVDEVVRGRHALAGTAQAVRVEHVALVQFVSGGAQIGGPPAIPDQAAHIRAALRERGGESATDESGGPRDECAHQTLVTRPCRCATAAASVRERTFSFARIRDT